MSMSVATIGGGHTVPLHRLTLKARRQASTVFCAVADGKITRGFYDHHAATGTGRLKGTTTAAAFVLSARWND